MATKPKPSALRADPDNVPELRVPRFAELDTLIAAGETAAPAVLPVMAVPVPMPTNSTLAAFVDELVDMGATLAPYRTLIAREEALRKLLRNAADASIPAEPAHLEIRLAGSKGHVILGPRAFQRSINLKALIKFVGMKKFCEFATTTFTALETYVRETLPIGVVTSDNSGARPLKVFQKAA